MQAFAFTLKRGIATHARTRQVDIDDLAYAPGTRRHDDDAVGQIHGFLHVVRASGWAPMCFARTLTTAGP
jgi:hypothetical protein